ncbi:eukaryotic translation initiation factor 3 subunit L [Pseudoscourfieldia marina]
MASSSSTPGGEGGGSPFLGMPDLARQFVSYLYRHIRERNVPEIHVMINSSFPKLSERYFKASAWPSPEAVAALVDHDHVFMLLYKELYYRHIYRQPAPLIEHRVASWANYQALFGVILHGNPNMFLPPSWLFSMIDEFAYQFQSFQHYRAKDASSRSDEETAVLAQAQQENVWNPSHVLNYLQALVDKSEVVEKLKRANATGRGDASVLENAHISNVLPLLGYYSLVGLCRVHCLLGDFHSALDVLSPIHLSRPGYYVRVPASHASVLYHAGFAYMASRRYVDAIRCLSGACVAVSRARVGFRGTPSTLEALLKRAEQSYALLACCLALVPRWEAVDEAVATTLKTDVWATRMSRLEGGEEGLFDELFSYGCPKFVTLVEDDHTQAFRAQLALFMHDVRARIAAASVASYLRLYSSISLDKLAVLSGEEVSVVRQSLMSLRSQSQIKTVPASAAHNASASATEGTFLSYDRIDFKIEGDIVRVIDGADAKTRGHGASSNYAPFFASALQSLDVLLKGETTA